MLDRWNSNTKDSKKCWGMMRGYQQSKLANVLFARALASRYNDKQITAYCVRPGVINTNLGQSMAFAGVLRAVVKKKTIPEGAATTLYCV